MALAYEEAIAALYQAPQEHFVAERKRLAAELKAGGDKSASARLLKLARPPLSAWAVNQLWWQARSEFEQLLGSGERLRQGERGAAAAHREALLALRARASAVLGEAGHAVTDATLRRVTATLTALAAAGSFAPDPPGALAADRDPPGFEALSGVAQWSTATAPSSVAEAAPARSAQAGAPGSAPANSAADAERRRAEADAERRRAEERARRQAERTQLEAEISRTQSALRATERELARLRTGLDAATERAEQNRSALRELQARLESLGPAE